MNAPATQPSRKDFVTDQDVRWCPGCGDYAILSQVQRLMPTLGVPRENIVFISGIGCSSRFPYYMNTYGFHTIHGRAPTIATGLKVARPELSVWVVTGDGDGLSIGGNHLMHILRRNVGVKILLLNNRIYGLTKGQYSPTSEQGKVTKSTPAGSADYPIQPAAFALGAQASFVARAIDVDNPLMAAVLERAARHEGTAFVEIYQNCNIFNDGAFAPLTEKATKADHLLVLQHGEPLLFGAGADRGIRMGTSPGGQAQCRLEVVALGAGITERDLLVHDETNPFLAHALAIMPTPDFPVPVGVLYASKRPTYESVVHGARAHGTRPVAELIAAGQTWKVEP